MHYESKIHFIGHGIKGGRRPGTVPFLKWGPPRKKGTHLGKRGPTSEKGDPPQKYEKIRIFEAKNIKTTNTRKNFIQTSFILHYN